MRNGAFCHRAALAYDPSLWRPESRRNKKRRVAFSLDRHKADRQNGAFCRVAWLTYEAASTATRSPDDNKKRELHELSPLTSILLSYINLQIDKEGYLNSVRRSMAGPQRLFFLFRASPQLGVLRRSLPQRIRLLKFPLHALPVSPVS